MMTNSTLCEFSNPTNSFKSLCSFAKRTPVAFDDTEQDVDALGRGQGSIEVVVGEIRIRETIVQLRNSFHLLNVPH